MPPLDAFRLPAEFEPHSATWLIWPRRPDNWRYNAYFAQQAVSALASIISHYEPVRIGAAKGDVESVKRRVPTAIEVIELDSDDIWVRDTGPTILIDCFGGCRAVDWTFNSWGGLFSSSENDDLVANGISDYEHIPVSRSNMVLEGGAILTDGNGTLLVTEESVLNPNRNPGMSKSDAERIFRDKLNVSNIVWLPAGLANDEAGGHIDNICAFASNEMLLLSQTDEATHPSRPRLSEASALLKRAKNAEGRSFTIVPIPLPPVTAISDDEARGFSEADGSIVRSAGTPLAPSYANLYIANGVVIVPTFNVPTDDLALRIIEGCFPGRSIVPFDSREFLLGGGAIHCLTKEIPIHWEGERNA